MDFVAIVEGKIPLVHAPIDGSAGRISVIGKLLQTAAK